MSNSLHKKGFALPIIAVAVALLIAILIFVLDYFNLIPKKSYTGADFGIETVKSSVDYNGNGTDDYTDILLGARADSVLYRTNETAKGRRILFTTAVSLIVKKIILKEVRLSLITVLMLQKYTNRYWFRGILSKQCVRFTGINKNEMLCSLH